MSKFAKTRIFKRLIVLPTFAAVLSMATGALAYNNREHERWPDQAYQLLNIINRGAYLTERVAAQTSSSPALLTERPASVPASEQALWDRFVAEMRTAAPKLDQLLVDLPDPNRTSADCGHAYPVLASGGHLASCRAGELPFVPRRGWNENRNLCYLRKGYQMGDADKQEFFAGLQSRNTGSLLGFYSQAVDDELKDSVLTVRVTSLGFAGAAKGLAEDLFELGVTVVLAPFVCLGEFIFGGGSNCLDDTENFAHDVDVIARIDEVLPDGIGRLESDTYTGLWHFLNVGHTGEFNRVPGMSYLDGGLDGQIDALDIALVVTTDLAGLTLDPDRSSGPSRYGQFADGAKNRRKADYWSTGIGHVEFEPLDNLAQFGWNRFATGKGASGLGWVLHALGDALQPHHTIAASGWGHRVYEEFAGQVWAEVFHEHKPEHYFDFAAALEHAYHWWRFIDDRTAGNNATPVPVKAFIEAVAGETRDLPSALPIFIPLISVPFAVNSHSDYPQRFYGDKKPQFFDLATRSMGATIAFLTKAAAFLQPAAATAQNDPCLCPTGQARVSVDLSGRVLHNDACLACGTGIFAATSLWLDGQCVAACPADEPIVVNGTTCASNCPIAGSCTGVSCPPELPFVEAGTCVARCAPGEVVVDNRTCATSCPAGQQADHGFCGTTGGAGEIPICNGQAIDLVDGCCNARGGSCRVNHDEDCCSGVCNGDGICVGSLGDSCTLNADCLTKTCTAGVCAKSPAGGFCNGNGDCLSNSCVDHKCQGAIGDPCQDSSECVGGICAGADPSRGIAGTCCLGIGASCTADGSCCGGSTCRNNICTTIIR